MRVLVVIPAYNEEKSILKTVQSILDFKASKDLDFQLDYIVINDGSKDKTKKILIENGLNAIHLISNLGIGGAVQTGYKYALENGYDLAVQFDGDGQHDIQSLPNLLLPIQRGEADLVIGSRFMGEVRSEFQTSFMRRFGIRIISFVMQLVTGWKIYDTTSGYRVANRVIIGQFAERYPRKYPEPESTVHVLKRRRKVVEVPANMYDRVGGSSSITPLKSIRYMIEVCSSILIAVFMKESE
ncbi:glycosyltransferase family 2 protein [Streptococcus acidominimus]|uniref:Glycosyltransferase family 2 protein n=1 Tax=Streptococcus acidominimus TaxID=1326 RepID=A0A4Y9FPD3_STRAI|nr:glycosyltransferase family 2 protein [Streptococcus acidominimus]MBF0818575.1 glycosyltransferase family 2 protein [Streptococcus acidominimus]MBF0838219.1 glycosyltransferase family 2 protein [Streptococcus acidominimus]MBF0847999.1 glycosyltransferase family 2 protein [Streptococcus danieliae]TFU31075.1 glycosyltransferase family 2 protein [Streptococcus acidominimus]